MILLFCMPVSYTHLDVYKRQLLHTDRVLIVEGKYDAARLSHLTDAMILLTAGFGIYKDKKRQQLFKQLAHKKDVYKRQIPSRACCTMWSASPARPTAPTPRRTSPVSYTHL